MSHIAFIGLGNMGAPMARNLLSAGYDVCGFDLSEQALCHHQQAGGRTAGSASEAARNADLVISMLPAGEQVKMLYLGDGSPGNPGLLAQLNSQTLVIDCSTIESHIARLLGSSARKRGIAFIDAPVSGGTAGAASGSLTFMIGGEADAVERARGFLEVMGQNLFHAGPCGAGQLAKVCNNMLLAVSMVATAEAMKLGMDNGLEPQVLAEIMKSSSGGNWVLNKYNPVPGVMPGVPAASDYRGGFATALMLKDLGLARVTAAESGSATPMGAAAESLYRIHRNQCGEQLDFSSIFQMYIREQ